MEEKLRRKTFLVFGAPVIEDEEIQEVIDSMKSGWLGTGPKVARFEEDFRSYKRATHAAAVNSCTAALHLSILVAGIKNGDEVITTPLTFCSTVNAIVHAGGTPVLADVDPKTMNIDPDQVRAKITKKTRAIVPVHFAGRPCAMDELCDISSTYSLKIIEDCAHAIESIYHGKQAGTIGDFGCFSFYSTKNLVTGEGGMVLAKNKADIDRIKILALHGMSKDAWKRFSDDGYKHYNVIEAGFKYNMMDLQAAIGIHQLIRVEKYWLRRKEIWDTYMEAFAGLPLILPSDPEPNTRHAYHLYSVRINENNSGVSRDDFLDAITEQNIGVGVHYQSIPEHQYYRNTYGWKGSDYPNAWRIGQETVSLPISAKLKDKDVEDVIRAVKKIILK